MLSSVLRSSLLVVGALLLGFPALVSSTCYVAEYNIFEGTAPLTVSPVNNALVGSEFINDRWPVTQGSPSVGGPALITPAFTPTINGYSYTLATDDCSVCTTCSQYVTIAFDMETPHNTFIILIGNAQYGSYYLSTASSNTTQGWKKWSDNLPGTSFLSPVPSDAWSIGAGTHWPGSTTTTFGTVFNRTFANDPTYYGGSNQGGFVNSAYGCGTACFPTIFQVPFPFWDCNSGSTNYIVIYDTLTGAGCTNQPNQFAVTRSCTGRGTGDPQFAGLRGQDYQVHGIDGGIYNVISDRYMQLNSKFVFLTGPRPCPVMPSTGKKSVACFAHAGSYLGNLALRTNADERVVIESGSASLGLKSVTLNGEALQVGDNVTLSFSNGATGSLSYLSSHEVLLRAGLFSIEVENSDSFLNLRSVVVSPQDWKELRAEKAHGLLGQTWNLRKDKSAIEGKVDDYLLESEDMFGTDFMFNRFGVSEQ